jgi:CheY-like chemotaxis protein
LAKRADETETGKIRILLVEDNMINRKVATKLIEKSGYTVDCALNGVEALKRIKKTDEPYDLILMDCQMPVMDGYEATREIRRMEGDQRRTPIIAITANAMKGDRQRCLAAGMDDYISKPINSEVLHAMLNHWLKRDNKPPSSD